MIPGSVLERPETAAERLPLPIEAGTSGGDPNAWCTSTCSTSGCSNQCSGNRGHSGSHACFEH